MFHLIFDRYCAYIFLVTFVNEYPFCHGAHGCEFEARYALLVVRIAASRMDSVGHYPLWRWSFAYDGNIFFFSSLPVPISFLMLFLSISTVGPRLFAVFIFA